MYNFFVDSHSVLRWILVLFFTLTIAYAFYSRSKGLPYERTRVLSLITLIVLHFQFLLGFILYFISPKVIFSGESMKAPLTRFFLVEHITAMLIGVALVTIGYSAAKKALNDSKKYNKLLIYYIIGSLIILAAVPWPFYNFGTGWF